MIATFLPGSGSESAPREVVGCAGAAKMDDCSEILFLSGGRAASLGPDRIGNLTIEKRRSHFNGMTRHDSTVETVEPTGVHVVPGAVFNDLMIVDAVMLSFLKRAVRDLKHADGAGGRLVPFQRVG